MNALQPPRRGADILAIAFGTTVVMWSLLYVAALAMWIAVAIGLAGCLFAAGFAAGRYAGRGPAGGAGQGLVLAGVTLLILLGLVGDESPRQAVWWVVGFLVAAVGLGAAGAAAGRRCRLREPTDMNWTAALAWVTTATVLLMLVAGGIVTGLEAGLAVEGWLIAEGHFLVLFPITLMQRDVGTFVEHAHRLWGVLVGLTTIVLMVHLWMVDRRRWVRGLSSGIVLAVIVQGVLGGTRVTESSVMLAMVHGVTAHVLFATLVVTAMATSRAWRDAGPPIAAPSVAADRTLTAAMVVVVLVQIVLGTFYRHLQPVPDASRGVLMGVLHGHSFVVSLLVVLMVLFCGVRAWGLYPTRPVISRVGKMLVYTLGLQVMLGFVSFVLVPKGVREPDDAVTLVEVVFTTAHQVTGAILFALAVALFVWERRLLTPKR
ncbi:MAG: COX15/CtaA family protein [Phycisphaerales bacterium]